MHDPPPPRPTARAQRRGRRGRRRSPAAALARRPRAPGERGDPRAPRPPPGERRLVGPGGRARLLLRRDQRRRAPLALLRPAAAALVPPRGGRVSYAALWVKSNLSFLVGASHPDELIDRAAELGLGAIALTDRDGVYGAVRAHVRARERGLKVIHGAEVRIARPPLPAAFGPLGGPLPAAAAGDGDDQARALLLAIDRRGWGALTQLLSRAHLPRPRGQPELALADLEAAAESPLLVLSDVPWLLAALAPRLGDRLYGIFARHRLASERRHELVLRDMSQKHGFPLVAAVEVLYHDRARRPLQDVLTCVRKGRTLADAGACTRPNAEHDLKSPAAMAALFADDPALVARTLEVAERCAFTLDDLSYRYPSGELPDGTSEAEFLRQLTLGGAADRYQGAIPEEARAQIDRELALIHELDFGGYFLTMWDIVRFCRDQGILCQGRGSAANSLVCYCLGITAIDPLRMDLLFERFLSRERADPPDIDLDIEHERREEVIHYVYGRYGRRYAAMVASIIRYRPRSAIREVGKVLGLPAAALDRAAKLHDHYGHELDLEILKDAGIDPASPLGGHLVELGRQILNFPRHLATHPCGFLLGHEPIDTLVPIEAGAMPGRTVIQWDKNDIEDLRLFKVDLLGLGALSHLHRCLELVRERHGRTLTLATIPAEDPETYAMLQAADTVGVFQVESRAQMAMLPRLRPATFYDLVVEVALVRPGPIQGDMVHPYLRRRCGEEPVTMPHPEVERILGKTLGVPLFQEQVMRLAIVLAGYTPGEADRLRRDMGAFRSPGRIEEHRERIVGRMRARGVDPDFAERLFAQIRGFGEYGFPESHAASFAIIAYASAWLRRHYLAAFTCALLNAQPMGFYAPATIIEDARRHGVEIRPIDVQRSAWECTLEDGASPERPAIRMGLSYVRGLRLDDRIALEENPPPHADLEAFVATTGLGADALQALAEAGAFRSFGLERRDAIWRARGLAARAGDRLRLEDVSDLPLFAPLRREEAVLWDYRRSGHSTHGHPLAALRPALAEHGIVDAAAVRGLSDGANVEVVGLAICRQRPQTARGVTFYTLEDERGFVNVVVWSQVFERHAKVAKTAAILGVSGRVQRSKEGVVHVIADTLWEATAELRGRRAAARVG
ncbi:MAG: error-prone DNA polymerase [Myxococcales bacterium]|nr:error-prone DNA polymerase [Myxococcales bacterium]